jgi:hypothetical protein
MATPAATPTAAFLAVIYSTLSLSYVNAALLVFFSAIRQRCLFAALLDSAILRDAIKTSLSLSIFALLLFFPIRSLRGKAETTRWDGPGKVLLFPCRTSHSRVFPKRHSFSYSYFTVGIPVDFEGHAGGMVSVGAKGNPGLLSWFLSASPRGWFTVDAGDYLERGKSELGLRGKLDVYLRAQVSLSRDMDGS